MNSVDAGKLPAITDAFNQLRVQGETIGVEILGITMTINGKPVQYTWDDVVNDWLITAQ